MAQDGPAMATELDPFDDGWWPTSLIRGAAPDDDEDDSDDEDGTDDEEDPDGDEGDEDEEDSGGQNGYTPPDEAEWQRVQAALAKANAEAKKHRLRARDLTRQREEHERTEAAARAASEGRTEEHERALAAAAAAEQRYKPVAVRSAARAAFMEAGLQLDPDPAKQTARMQRLVRMLDMDEIEIDDDGEVVGLDTQVTAIQTDYPELFRPVEAVPAGRKRVRPIDAANRDTTYYAPPRSTGERIAAQVLGSDWDG